MIPQACPHCRRELRCTSAVLGSDAPKPGDCAICAQCSAVLIFDANGMFRLAEREDLEAMDTTTLTAILAARHATQSVRRMRN